MDLGRLVLHWFAGIGLTVAMALVTLVFASFGVPLSLLTLITGQLGVTLVVAIFAFVILAIIFGYIGVVARNILYEESEVSLGLEEIPRLWFHGVLLVVAMMLLVTVFGLLGLTISLTIFGDVLESSVGVLLVLAILVIATIFGWVNFELTERLY